MPRTRIGTVSVSVRYVVDMDDEEMVDQAKECIYDDLVQMLVKNPGLEEFYAALKVECNPVLTESDIDDFLVESAEDRE